jgi:hypothetical protein
MKRTIRWGALSLLLIICVLGGTVVNNNLAHKRLLDQFLEFCQPMGFEVMDSISYMSAANGDCWHFAGAAICADAPVESIVQAFDGLDQTAIGENLTFVWAVGDSFAIQPLGLGKTMSSAPVNISYLGGDANYGVRRLLDAGGCNLGRMVLFSFARRSNLLDFRCY